MKNIDPVEFGNEHLIVAEITLKELELAKIKYKSEGEKVMNIILKLEKIFGNKIPKAELKDELKKFIEEEDYENGIEILECSGEIFSPDDKHLMRVENLER